MRKHIPNTITCLNLMSGCVAIERAIEGEPLWALAFIVLGAVFDFFDGMTARLLRVSSPIGKELDSLADVVTFGVAPSAMVFNQLWGLTYLQVVSPQSAVVTYCTSWLPYVAFVMAAFSALRLAKFNLDERQSTSFIGLPTPANALFWASLIVGGQDTLFAHWWAVWVVLPLLLLSCWLLVAEIPMFALKFKHWGWQGNQVKYVFLISCLPILVFFRVSGIAVIIAWYVLLSKISGSLAEKT